MYKPLSKTIFFTGLLIALTGLFSPANYIFAEPLGNCLVENSTSSQVVPNKTTNECSALGVKITWTPNPSSTPTLLGSCLVDNSTSSQILQNKTIIECNALKVTTIWTQVTPINPNTTPSINTSTTIYTPLAPLPGLTKPIDTADPNALGIYLNAIIKLAIGLSAVLAVLMIIMGGLEYITSELPGAKGEGKQRITNAVIGLLVALGAWLLLFTINPKLLDTNLSSLTPTTIDYVGSPESNTPFNPASKGSLQSLGIICNGSGGKSALASVAQSFVDKVTYDQNKRGTIASTTAYFDCSSFVAQVYNCVGLSSPGNTTLQIFNKARPPIGLRINLSEDLVGTSTAINGRNLQIGDLVGWQAGDNGKKWGHVMMYIGNGMVIDSQGPTGSFNTSVKPRTLSSMRNALKYVIWAP